MRLCCLTFAPAIVGGGSPDSSSLPSPGNASIHGIFGRRANFGTLPGWNAFLHATDVVHEDGASLKVLDPASQPTGAIVPVRVRIFDPAGVEAEFSGYHAAVAGQLDITLDFAPNDRKGIWEIQAEELASGLQSKAFVRLTEK